MSVVQEITQPQADLPGLAGAKLAMSSDNYHLYLASYTDEAVSVFSTPTGLNPVREVYLPLIVK